MDAPAPAAPRPALTAPAAFLDWDLEQLARTAVHEAGHVVAATVFRFPAGHVSARPSEENMGVHHMPTPRYGASALAFRRHVRRLATEGLLITLAGPAAERRRWPDTPWDDEAFSGDLAHARWLTLGAGGIPRDVSLPHDQAYLDAAMRVADDLAARTWPAIVALATVLCREGELGAGRAKALAAGALGDAAALRRELRAALRPAEHLAAVRLARRDMAGHSRDAPGARA